MIKKINNGYSNGNTMRRVTVFCAVFVVVYYALKHFEGFHEKRWGYIDFY